MGGLLAVALVMLSHRAHQEREGRQLKPLSGLGSVALGLALSVAPDPRIGWARWRR